MPATKPGVELNGEELCQGCTHHEMRAENDYEDAEHNSKNSSTSTGATTVDTIVSSP
jgi:hypothetical protein